LLLGRQLLQTLLSWQLPFPRRWLHLLLAAAILLCYQGLLWVLHGMQASLHRAPSPELEEEHMPLLLLLLPPPPPPPLLLLGWPRLLVLLPPLIKLL
jgi:hypothetical protein